MGERGGTSRYNNGLIRIGILRDKAKEVDWERCSDRTFQAKIPGRISKPAQMRTISDLHLSDDGRLFASAAIDGSDHGPFQSLVYEVGMVSFKKGKLVITRSKNKEVYKIDGFKVEALSVSPEFMNNTQFL